MIDGGKINEKKFDRGYDKRYTADVMNEMIGEILKLRRVLGLSQEQLSQRLGISWMTIYRWESGKTKPIGLYRKKIERMIKKYLEVSSVEKN